MRVYVHQNTSLLALKVQSDFETVHTVLVVTEDPDLEQVLWSLLANEYFVGGFVGLLLDNILPGKTNEIVYLVFSLHFQLLFQAPRKSGE